MFTYGAISIGRVLFFFFPYILNKSPVADVHFANIFSPSLACLIVFKMPLILRHNFNTGKKCEKIMYFRISGI